MLQAPEDYCQTAADVRAAADRVTAWRKSLMVKPVKLEPVIEPPKVVLPKVPEVRPEPVEAVPSILEIPFSFTREAGRPTISSVIEAVSHVWSVPVVRLKTRERTDKVVEPRQVAMTLARLLARRSLPEIGRQFNRDHTTVLHAIRKREWIVPVIGLSVREPPMAWAIGAWNVLHPETDNGSAGAAHV